MVLMPHWPTNFVQKMGLNRVEMLLSYLGNPHHSFPPVVHIAGTNGKGSTFAYLKHILEESGYVVHGYISPHLVSFNERIIVSGSNISDSMLYDYTEIVRKVVESKGLEVTFFEAITVIAFLIFGNMKADVLIIETGLGGIADATNVCLPPLVSIITPISLDHMEYLGETIEKIALEKAGIIKKNGFCVISEQKPSVMEILLKRCSVVGSVPVCCGKDWSYFVNNDESIEVSIGGNLKESNSFVNEFSEKVLVKKIGLLGLHQFMNAATSVAAAVVLASNGYSMISVESINLGIKNVVWPGRMQKITSGSLYEILGCSCSLWFDGAHNDGGAEALAANIAKYLSDKPTYMIFSRIKGRDNISFLKYFLGIVKHIFCVPIDENENCVDPLLLLESAQTLGFSATAEQNIWDAIGKCREYAGLDGANVVIAGSLYMGSIALKDVK